VDPLVNETGQPYAYTGDDPVNGVDPGGLKCVGAEGFLNSIPLGGSACNVVRGNASAIAGSLQGVSAVFSGISVSAQLVTLGGLVGLPEDAPFEVTAAEIAADTSKVAAFSELLGCAVKDTSNCSAHNVSLDVLTLLAPSILSLAPADFRRGAEVGEGLNDIINWVRSHPLFTPAGAAEPASACNLGPQP
jgi:hypothetical protein